MRGDRWKSLHGKIRALGIKKADRPVVVQRFQYMLLTLIEGRLPDDEHWVKYMMEKHDRTGVATETMTSRMAGRMREFEALGNGEIGRYFAELPNLYVVTMLCML